MYTKLSDTRLRNDLIWCIASPELLNDTRNLYNHPISEDIIKWLTKGCHASAFRHLLRACRPRRLGIYFELLWRYILSNYPAFRLIAHNYPIYRHKQTLGEFDFIYYCREREAYFHLETTVKFYLGVGDNGQDGTAHNHWIGPATSDRLDLKLAHMTGHQSALSKTPEGQQALNDFGIDTVQREISIKGYLFYPDSVPFRGPANINPFHQKGKWLCYDAIDGLSTDALWKILDKPEWLSPVSFANGERPISTEELTRIACDWFTKTRFPLKTARIERNGNSQQWAETERVFIVPTHWPYAP